MLLRVDYSSIDNEGTFISIKDPDPVKREMAYYPPPDYNTGAYSTLYYLISDEERDLYAIRKSRKVDLPLNEVMLAITQAVQARAKTQESVRAFFKKELN